MPSLVAAVDGKGLDVKANCSVRDALAGEDRFDAKAAALQLFGRAKEATAARANREGLMDSLLPFVLKSAHEKLGSSFIISSWSRCVVSTNRMCRTGSQGRRAPFQRTHATFSKNQCDSCHTKSFDPSTPDHHSPCTPLRDHLPTCSKPATHRSTLAVKWPPNGTAGAVVGPLQRKKGVIWC